MAGRAQERLACQVIRRGTLAKWRCGSGRTRRQEDWSVKWLGGRNASFNLQTVSRVLIVSHGMLSGAVHVKVLYSRLEYSSWPFIERCLAWLSIYLGGALD